MKTKLEANQMNESAFIAKMKKWVEQNVVVFEAFDNPDSFNPRCSHHATKRIGATEYQLNWDDASEVLRLYDDAGLAYTTTHNASQLGAAIADQTSNRQPEAIFDAFVTELGDPDKELKESTIY